MTREISSSCTPRLMTMTLMLLMLMKFLLKGIGLWKENMVVEEVMAEAEAEADAAAVAEVAAASEAAVALKNKWNELFWFIWDL